MALTDSSRRTAFVRAMLRRFRSSTYRALHVLVVTTALGVFGAAHARDCGNPTTQSKSTACSRERLEKLDADLNRTYRDVVQSLSAAQKEALTAAENQWIRFRDAECGFVASATGGGTAAGMVETDCKSNLTNDRVRQLRSYLSCEEGDLACVGRR